MYDEATPRGWWSKGAIWAEQASQWAKLVVLVLATIGFVCVYVPSLRRGWERRFLPADWYWIGTVERGRFSNNDYLHPLWNGGPVDSASLNSLRDSVVVTQSDDLHIGRSDASGRSPADAIVGKHQCLYVTDVATKPDLDGAHRVDRVWIKARHVTC